jgi:hypothetical protein
VTESPSIRNKLRQYPSCCCAYSFCSNFWRCLSAKAVIEEVALSESMMVEVLALCVMVMSTPMVSKGKRYGYYGCHHLGWLDRGQKRSRKVVQKCLLCWCSSFRSQVVWMV